MRTILILGGEPASGKSTLMRRFMSEMGEWNSSEPKKTLQVLYNKKSDCYVLGKYEEGVLFAGTDRLSMSVQPVAGEFVKETQSNIVLEGDRLFKKKFIDYIMTLSDTRLMIIHVKADEDVMKNRHKDRGDDQTETFIKSRHTKVNNIVTSPELSEFVAVRMNNDISQQISIVDLMKKLINVTEEEYESIRKANKNAAPVSGGTLSDFF